MNGKSNEIASQLRGIKKALILGAACLFVSAASNIYYVVDDVRENTERRIGRTFEEKAGFLRGDQQWDALLKLALDRQRESPLDYRGWLFSGIALLNKNQFDQAERDFKHMVKINPAMEKLADAWLKAVEDKRKQVLGQSRPQIS